MVWIRSAYRHVMRATLLVVTCAALMLGFGGRWLISVWAGKSAVPDLSLLWGMCFWAILLAFTVNQAALMAATQRLQLQAVCSTLAAILNLLLSVVLVKRNGSMGVLSANNHLLSGIHCSSPDVGGATNSEWPVSGARSCLVKTCRE